MTKKDMIETLEIYVFALFVATVTVIVYGLAIYTILKVFGVIHD